MHDSLSQVKLNEGIWELLGGAAIGDQDGDARWRARHLIPRDQLLCERSIAPLEPLDRIGLSQLPLAALSISPSASGPGMRR